MPSTTPLADFQAIGHNTLVYTPTTYTTKTTAPLILVFSWMGAATKHIAKYTIAYQRLFPSARIVLVRCELVDMFRAEQEYAKLLAPALDTVHAHVRSGGEVLVHSFSNGGATQLLQFAKAWKRKQLSGENESENENDMMPMRAQIMDSSPGLGGWRKSHAAIVLSMPKGWLWRFFGSLAAHLLLVGLFLRDKVLQRENMIVAMAKQLNDPRIFLNNVPRVYLYSKADSMVGDDEVEHHANQAASKGWHVRKVRFEKSPHAGHVREDEAKYWDAVMQAWKRGA
ncbi:DUF829-domain-containing protein [Lojkania enalia]|uniref:DUF829-domain-containing protein n=1 Tax=Lojkania enalia TaxID=147567 RepID=A0A9P4KB16_9PLEO|nr:DUF829-domain-containing protein [Didymosphaeria enalia]